MRGLTVLLGMVLAVSLGANFQGYQYRTELIRTSDRSQRLQETLEEREAQTNELRTDLDACRKSEESAADRAALLRALSEHLLSDPLIGGAFRDGRLAVTVAGDVVDVSVFDVNESLWAAAGLYRTGLREEAASLIRQIAGRVAGFISGNVRVDVQGHADPRIPAAGAAANWTVSGRRAESAERELKFFARASGWQLTASAHSASALIDAADDDLNRRLVLTFQPLRGASRRGDPGAGEANP